MERVIFNVFCSFTKFEAVRAIRTCSANKAAKSRDGKARPNLLEGKLTVS
jgi:hypothetical protein